MRLLILSHFNLIKGPKEVFKIPDDIEFKELKTITKQLSLEVTDFFIYDYQNFKTANLRFQIPSQMKRIDYEDLMLTVVIIDEMISPKIFQSILNNIKEELQDFRNLYEGLYKTFDNYSAKLEEIKKVLVKYYQSINEIKGINLDHKLDHDLPWGTHICYFYQKKEDLMDILIPYIKKGLEENQFCVWVTSEDLNEYEAKNKLTSEVKNFNELLEKGQIEIFPYKGWYLKEGKFNFQTVLEGWVDKYNYAISHGYNGLRVTGNTAWLEEHHLKDFNNYEEEINKIVGNYRMIVLCTYSLDKCGVNEILGVMKSHQVATIRKEGKWEVLQKLDDSVYT